MTHMTRPLERGWLEEATSLSVLRDSPLRKRLGTGWVKRRSRLSRLSARRYPYLQNPPDRDRLGSEEIGSTLRPSRAVPRAPALRRAGPSSHASTIRRRPRIEAADR